MADGPLFPAKTKKPRGQGKRFEKGVSGNPNGRPRLPPEVRERAQHYGPEMVDVLRGLAVDTEQTGAVRVSAAVAVLDRGFGKPTASIVAAQVDLLDLINASYESSGEDEGSSKNLDAIGEHRD